MSLRAKALSGGLWAAASQFGQLGLQFVVGIILARLLDPSDYGLIALSAVFLTICQSFSEGGFGLAVIQRKNLADDNCSTVFWFNLAASIPVYLLILFAAPLVAAFYREPALTPVFQVLGVGVLISAPSTVQRALMERRMDFRRLTIIQLPSILLGAFVGVLMAWHGFGAWALVAMSLTTSAASSAALWGTSKWKPRVVFQRQVFREMFGYGFKNALERVSNTVFQNLITIVIGRTFSATEVGYYNRARQYQQLPAQSINSIFLRVLLPMLSSVQDHPEKRHFAFTQSLRLATMASFPVFAGIFAVAGPLIHVLIGAKWMPCVPYLQILCFSAAFLPLGAINVNAILSQGRSGLSLKLNLIKQGMQLVAVILTFRHGIIAMLWAQAAVALISVFVNAWPNRKLMNVPVFEQWMIIAPYALLSSLMACVVLAVAPVFGGNSLLQLLGGSLTGVVFYLTGLKLMRLRSHRQLASLASGIPVAGRFMRFVLQ